MSATKSSITGTWWTASKPRARCSSRNCRKCPPAPSPSSARMAWPRAVEEEAARRGLNVIDATCPLVSKVHNQANRYVRDARQLILIGHAGHPEVEGTKGRIRGAGASGADRGRCRKARDPARHAGRLCDADDAERGRHPRHHRGAGAEILRRGRPGHARYLLCDAKPAKRGARPVQARRRAAGGGGQQQFQFQPPARNRRRFRHPQLSDRRRRPN